MAPQAITELVDSAEVTLDGTGAGVVRFGPPRPGQEWRISHISLDVAGGLTVNPDAFAGIYVGPRPVPLTGRYLRLTSYNAAFDAASGDPPLPVRPGDELAVAWEDAATSGVLAVAHIEGIIISS